MSARNESRRELKLRRRIVVALFVLGAAVLSWRAIDLQVNKREFLQNHGDARYLRVERIDANRGMILDRNGEPLAISTPTQSAWVQPRRFVEAKDKWPKLAKILGIPFDQLETLIMPRLDKKFVYLQRHLTPDEGDALKRLEIAGLNLQEEQRRYYPAGEVAAHILGFTNVDDQGQEGVELSYDHILKGEPGQRRVIKDRIGRVVEDVERLRATRPGRDVYLSIDQRIQYAAYRALKIAVQQNEARAGMMVVVDPHSGEVLALVNQPSFNPNNRDNLNSERYRNRAVTDLFEPGSTLKPFTLAAALESGQYKPESQIDTSPGRFKIGKDTVRDIKNYGVLDLGGIIQNSSNVGASKVALSLEPEVLWKAFRDFGFGSISEIALPGEGYGRLNEYRNWSEIEHATLAFGYGLSVTAAQLARAYTVLANDGWMQPLSIVKLSEPEPRKRIISANTAQEIRRMLTRVITKGTGALAAVPGYSVAGKTGTVHKSISSGYAEHRYRSLFAGMIPAENPRLVAVVIIDEPQRGVYFGGKVAAPVFASVMRDAVRILNIPPDQPVQATPEAVWLATGHDGDRAAESTQ
ncbi:MAG: penicillin-binding protein 2 [Proteobacteria bacterium]|jgi:cell division protein FtsI (penicillin-binding protein 3)|nr:penicillin-binding protein 2 [Pseudomonadota bacterium]